MDEKSVNEPVEQFGNVEAYDRHQDNLADEANAAHRAAKAVRPAVGTTDWIKQQAGNAPVVPADGPQRQWYETPSQTEDGDNRTQEEIDAQNKAEEKAAFPHGYKQFPGIFEGGGLGEILDGIFVKRAQRDPRELPGSLGSDMLAFTVRPAFVIGTDSLGSFDKDGKLVLADGVEDRLHQYRDNGYVMLCIGRCETAGLDGPSPQDVIESVDGAFKVCPFGIIYVVPTRKNGPTYPFNLRSLREPPAYGILGLLEDYSWSAGVILDWDRSLVVNCYATDDLDDLADRANVERADSIIIFG